MSFMRRAIIMANANVNKKFIESIAPFIVSEAQKRGYKYPSAIIAQACLESAYGTSQLSAIYHNYFGLKCGTFWTGASVNMKTMEEYHKGTSVMIRDFFRAYTDIEEGVKGYFDFISTRRYANLKSATSSKNYLEIIKGDGYATSSKYVDNVYAVVTKYNLTKYDAAEPVKADLDIDKIAKDVIKGKYGNGEDRKRNLSAIGVDYAAVQKRVNELLKGNK